MTAYSYASNKGIMPESEYEYTSGETGKRGTC